MPSDPAARRYDYIGPSELRDQLTDARPRAEITSAADLAGFLTRSDQDPAEPCTFVIDTHGRLRLAPRQSEHVACAAGQPVLAAGEIGFTRHGTNWAVTEVTNQSTGYCPDPDCWPAVAAALDQAGIAHPGGFTAALVFRRCEHCGQRNIVKDDWFVCGTCGHDLPQQWNFAPP
jgi:hypothetical protein